jgi:hypothetical protein
MNAHIVAQSLKKNKTKQQLLHRVVVLLAQAAAVLQNEAAHLVQAAAVLQNEAALLV